MICQYDNVFLTLVFLVHSKDRSSLRAVSRLQRGPCNYAQRTCTSGQSGERTAADTHKPPCWLLDPHLGQSVP